MLNFQVTPTLGVLAALLVLLVVREPVRGISDGQRTSRSGVRGKTGFSAYIDDICYLFGKLVCIICINFYGPLQWVILNCSMTFLLSTVGFTATAFTAGALAQWAPTFIERVSGMIKPGHGYGDST